MTSIKKLPRKAGRNTGGYVPSGSVTKTGGRTSSTLGAGTKFDPDQRTGAPQAFKDLLKNNATDEFSALLSSLGVNYNDELSEAEIADWNHQLATTQLAYEVEKEKRGYNEQMRDEQRIYDSPTNMLARLMGAGISRDAAIQMLSGAGGSSPIQSGDYTAAPGIAPSESNRNAIESKLAVANTVIGGISAVTGLVNLGFTIPQSIAQTNYLKNSNLLTGKQLKAYDAASGAYSVLNAIDAGSEAFGSVGSAIKAINDAATAGDPTAVNFVNSGGIESLRSSSPYASSILSNLYKSERASTDYSEEMTRAARRFDAELELNSITVSKLRKETDKMNAEIADIEKSTEYKDAMKKVCVQQIENLKSEKKKMDQETAKLLQETWSAYYQHLLSQDEYEVNRDFLNTEVEGKTGRDWLNDSKINELVRLSKVNAKLNNDEYVDSLVEQMFLDPEMAAAVLKLQIWKLNATAQELEEYPEYARLASATELLYKDYFNVAMQNEEIVSGPMNFGHGTMLRSKHVGGLTNPARYDK